MTKEMISQISVVIPNYNYGRYLGQAIESVLAQTVPVQEIIVVDDGSTDETPSIVAQYGDSVKLIRQPNRGVGAARNNGVANSKGEIIAFLDADDIWMPQKLERQLQRMGDDPEVGLVSCGLLEVRQNGEVVTEHKEGLDGWVAEDMLLFKKTVISGSSIIVYRKVFEAVGGFDEDKKLHPSEDWDFGFRVARICKLGFIPESLVYYRNHGANGHLNIKRMEQAVRIALAKVFADTDPRLQSLRRKSYGNQYMILAASYFGAGQYMAFIRNALKSLFMAPGNIARLLGYPLRKLKRKAEERKNTYQTA